jgi:hypothetical protein
MVVGPWYYIYVDRYDFSKVLSLPFLFSPPQTLTPLFTDGSSAYATIRSRWLFDVASLPRVGLLLLQRGLLRRQVSPSLYPLLPLLETSFT